MSKISVSRDDEVHRKVDITLKDPDKEVIKKYREEITKEEIYFFLFSEFVADTRGEGRGGVCLGAAGLFLPPH